jgi:hypothetical protein
MDFKEVQIYYHIIHSPKIQYITQMLPIPLKATKDITRQGTIIALQSTGDSSKTPHGITYGHTHFGGLERMDIHTAQNLINFTRSMPSCHSTHTAVKIAYLWWGFQDGGKRCSLQHYTQSSTITKSIWLTELGQFIHKHGIRVHLDCVM